MSDADQKDNCTCWRMWGRILSVRHNPTCPAHGEDRTPFPSTTGAPGEAQMTAGLESLRFALQRSRRVMELLAAGDISEHEAIAIVTRIVDEVL